VKAGFSTKSNIECRLRRDFAGDAGSDSYWWLTSEPAAANGVRIRVVITCSGKPTVGVQSVWPASPCRVVEATVSNNGVEWIGLWGIQGTFVLNITVVRPVTVGDRKVFEVHGLLDAALPVSNSFEKPLALRAGF
jgi:hypothetical protein